MDNLTHTVIGVIAGEGLAQSSVARQRRVACIALVTIGSNLPDLDLFYSYGPFGHGKLDYLLEHRGHTHTIVGCVVLAAMLYALAALCMRARTSLTVRDHVVLAGAALLGTQLHLLMDALNSYGVHPFWPVWNGWLYGDSVFIVEPLYWVAVAPLFFVVRSLVGRGLIVLVLALAPAASAWSGFVPESLVLVLAAFAVVLLAIGWRLSPRACALLSVAMLVHITAMFVICGLVAERRLEQLTASEFPGERTIDRVLTPMPVNPLCWDVLLLQQQGDQYRARRAMLSLAPSLMRAGHCPARAEDSERTAPQTQVLAASSDAIRWRDEFSMSVSDLRSVVRSSCVAARAMQFIRAPFVAPPEGKSVIGDLRFDREPAPGFTELELEGPDATGPCPPRAPWIEPRAALLR